MLGIKLVFNRIKPGTNIGKRQEAKRIAVGIVGIAVQLIHSKYGVDVAPDAVFCKKLVILDSRTKNLDGIFFARIYHQCILFCYFVRIGLVAYLCCK